jgi:hypothetical protein
LCDGIFQNDTREQHRGNIRGPACLFMEPLDRLLLTLAFGAAALTVVAMVWP